MSTDSTKLNILVIHGYVQSAATVAGNTRPLQKELSDIATLHYVDGPPMSDGGWSTSRPWWILNGSLDHDTSDDRWDDVVKWWSDELSQNQYDGIIGLSQGSAMAALLLSMINHPTRVPDFQFSKVQPIKFAILCSGFISRFEPHKDIYGIPESLRTLHTVDDKDLVVPAERTIALSELCKTARIVHHNEGHAIPVQGSWPQVFKEFILDAIATPLAA